MATLLLLGLATVMLGLTTAYPVPPSKPTPAREGCNISIFQSISPQTRENFRNANDALEESRLQKDVRCSPKLFPRRWKLVRLQVQERLKALQAELHLTLQVLENVTDSALYRILEQPLHTLRHIHSQLQACIQPEPAAEPRPPSHRLSRWLHRLREAQEKETPGCLEISVTSNLLRLLIQDLRCVAREDQCA
ncbi:interferon lambda-1 isoform X2 [Cricetulus griseus]|uniref:Interferon lambda-1 isoform X2 n=2 Tax=Cricetulus griseus TaxID=10029 RepID=A0A9J7GJZ6_CRIGR|nr:interferon lambda-1 isoform X2 [Cricetulus griseus]